MPSDSPNKHSTEDDGRGGRTLGKLKANPLNRRQEFALLREALAPLDREQRHSQQPSYNSSTNRYEGSIDADSHASVEVPKKRAVINKKVSSDATEQGMGKRSTAPITAQPLPSTLSKDLSEGINSEP
eukprot:CAMPEP_0175041814 /NCGR_PEP_ID=MMETSP0052_2-20121109/2156_1 /TAXON_ID=51329 ORGANISM="Polytomella parva, Strain SAG 63-3" /NCGR_SAMPLE_ID=MMETSP0052_2 /ASSEMBLY_ACC=CAM_ASM_000194 /LENGTH=127 /DNA_ID=CAMNT_0016304435 /DNA_START=326 /DNA_END=709 /DNA_ORIENTATION=-